MVFGRQKKKKRGETAERGFESTTWQPHFAMLPSRTFLVLPSSFFFPESVEIGQSKGGGARSATVKPDQPAAYRMCCSL